MTITGYKPEELDEHTLGHILSEMADQEREDGPGLERGHYTRPQWREILLGVGYPPAHATQILDAWFVKCTTCGNDATHLWASFCEDGSWGSMAGPFKFAPSCDNCTGSLEGDIPQQGVIRAPLQFEAPTEPPVPSSGQLAAAFAEDDPMKIENAIAVAVSSDAGATREAVAAAVKALAHQVAVQTRGEVHQVSFDEVLLDVLTDARGH